jgi:hypothetical protein
MPHVAAVADGVDIEEDIDLVKHHRCRLLYNLQVAAVVVE